jgi:hypothetical protein
VDLEAAGYDVLLDVVSLKPGDAWRAWMWYCLGACDAAVILLSEAALSSHHLTFETSVLAHRKATWDQALLLLPVLLGAATPEALAKSYLDPAQLDESQMIRGTQEEIVTKVLESLQDAHLCEQTPAEKRARRVARLFHGLHEDALLEAGGKIGLDLPRAAWSVPLHLALRLLSIGMTAAIPGLLELRPEFPLPERAEKMDRLIELVASSWVDHRCVGRIPEIAKGKLEPHLRAIGLNVSRWDAAKLYVASASHDDPLGTWRMTSCTGTFGDLDELIHQVRESLRFLLTASSDEDLVAELKAFDKSGQPVIVGLTRAGLDDDAVARLRQEFPHVTFFLMMGFDDTGVPLSPSKVEMLFPPLQEGEESIFLEDFADFDRAVRFKQFN